MLDSKREQSWDHEIRVEFEMADKNCQRYFDRMYRTLEFSFAAIVAIVGIGFTLFEKSMVDIPGFFLFAYVLPVCLYVFGMTYIYNAYALAVYGKTAEVLHHRLYLQKDNLLRNSSNTYDQIMKKYVMTHPRYTKIAYGVCVAFFVILPGASIGFGWGIFGSNVCCFFKSLAVALCVIYKVLSIILICAIIKEHNETQKLIDELEKSNDNFQEVQQHYM